MDFVRLGAPYSTSYYPDKLIEGYNSLIWTERFLEPGEFELKSFDVEGLLDLLPENTLVSHLETREVMQVETHEINMVGEGADAQPEITIKGRSATIIFDHRWIEGPYQKKRRMRKRYSAAGAAEVLMYNAVDNASLKDVTRGDDDPEAPIEENDFPWTDKGVIPNVAITESISSYGETRWWQIQQGPLYPQLLRILDSQDLGIRCMRPVSPSPATVVTVKSALAERGTIVRTDTADVTKLRFEVYSGLDRSASVQFSMLQGHLDNPKYLISNKEYKSVAEIMSGEVVMSDVYRDGESGLTGWQRKTMPFDAGTPDIPPEPEKPEPLKKDATKAQKEAYADAMDEWINKHAKWKNKKAAIVADFKEEQSKAALRELKKRRRVNMFSGDISQLSPYKYKTHYNLGDTVMMYGDYKRSAKMIVGEYVRTEDVNGDRGFPGLVEP